VPAGSEADGVLRERVKERILQFLIECGPPKGLCAIKEEDRSMPPTPRDRSVPSTPRAHQHAVDICKLMEASCCTPSGRPLLPHPPQPLPPPVLPRAPCPGSGRGACSEDREWGGRDAGTPVGRPGQDTC